MNFTLSEQYRSSRQRRIARQEARENAKSLLWIAAHMFAACFVLAWWLI